MGAFGCVALLVQGDKPGSIPACWAVGGAGWVVVSQFTMKRESGFGEGFEKLGDTIGFFFPSPYLYLHMLLA